MSTPKINKLELLKRLTTVDDEEIETYLQKSDAEVEAELSAAGVDAEAAWQRFQKSVAHITGDRESFTKRLADGVELVQQGLSRWLRLTLEGTELIEQAYAPSTAMGAETDAEIRDAIAEFELHVVPYTPMPIGDGLLLPLRWIGESPASAPPVRIKVGDNPADELVCTWRNWHPGADQAQVLRIDALSADLVEPEDETQPVLAICWNDEKEVLELHINPIPSRGEE